MRLIASAAIAALVGLGAMAPAKAGLLELPFDNISRYRDCNAQPCRTNNLHWKRVWVHAPYLRFDIHSSKPRYALRRERVIGADGTYQWVSTPVLMAPAQNYVTRRSPHYAYFPDTIAVVGQ